MQIDRNTEPRLKIKAHRRKEDKILFQLLSFPKVISRNTSSDTKEANF